MRFWGGGKPIQIGTKCCPKWPRMCWLYMFLRLFLNWHLVLEGTYILNQFQSSLSPLMVQNLVCAQNWLQAHVPISFHKSKGEIEALEDEFHDLGNMFNFQTSCLLSVIKCVIYLVVCFRVSVLITLGYYYKV